MFSDRTCFVAQACIEVRLSAASLIFRKLHLHAKTVENAHYGLTRLRVEGIDEAGDEKLNGGHQSILIPNLFTIYLGSPASVVKSGISTWESWESLSLL